MVAFVVAFVVAFEKIMEDQIVHPSSPSVEVKNPFEGIGIAFVAYLVAFKGIMVVAYFAYLA